MNQVPLRSKSEFKGAEEVLDRRLVVGGDAPEDAAEGPRLDGVVVGDGLVVLAPLGGRHADVGAFLPRRLITQLAQSRTNSGPETSRGNFIAPRPRRGQSEDE